MMVNTMAPAVELVKPIAEFGTSEVTYSLTWFYSSSKLLACGMNGKSIKIYDLRGNMHFLISFLYNFVFLFFGSTNYHIDFLKIPHRYII